MNDRRRLPEPRHDADRKLLGDVEDTGWHVPIIPDEQGTPGWAFSIGLFYNYGQPEIIMFGLRPEAMHSIVNLAGKLARDGQTLRDGLRSADLIEGLECAFSRVEKTWYKPLLGYATWFYQGDDFPALQCVWPDRRGRFPTEADFDPAFLPRQPNLAATDPDEARMTAILRTMGD